MQSFRHAVTPARGAVTLTHTVSRLHSLTHAFPSLNQAPGSAPTCAALLLTQGGQVQPGPFPDEAVLRGVGSPLQLGVRDAGVLLDLHRGALQSQHNVPQSLLLAETPKCLQQLRWVPVRPPKPPLLRPPAQEPQS